MSRLHISLFSDNKLAFLTIGFPFTGGHSSHALRLGPLGGARRTQMRSSALGVLPQCPRGLMLDCARHTSHCESNFGSFCRGCPTQRSRVPSSVVGTRFCSSSVSHWSSVVLSVVRRPFPFPVLRLPNCRGTLSPTAFHHGRPVCLLPPPGLLTVSQLSSSRLQLTLPTTVRGVSPAPPFGFRLLASARRLPPLGPLRSSTSPPRLRGSLLLLGLPQASRDRLVPSCPRRLAGLGKPLSGLSRAIPSGRLASPEGFLLYEFRSSGSFPRFLLGPFWVP